MICFSIYIFVQIRKNIAISGKNYILKTNINEEGRSSLLTKQKKSAA